MITPLFKINQDENFVIVTAQMKYVKFSDFDYFIENNNFRFSLKPYHLNITFPHNIVSDSEKNHFSYDIETQLLTCKLEKQDPGTFFENLDLISTLFTQKSSNQNQNSNLSINKIEEISTDINSESNNIFKINVTNQSELNQYLFDSYSLPEMSTLNLNTNESNKEEFNFGFNNSYNDVFDKRSEDAVEICSLNPKKVPLKFRYLTKMQLEMGDFNPERYIYDLYLSMPSGKDNDLGTEEDYQLVQFRKIMNQSNEKFLNELKINNTQNASQMIYDEKELQVLQEINKTKLNFISDSSNSIHPFKFYLQIVDILFSFLYDLVTNEYEPSSESGWNINKLSSVLSCFVDFDKNFYSQSKEISFSILEELVTNVLASCYRRILIYPLYRNLELCNKIKKELGDVLILGRFSILKCLIKIRIVFEKSEPRYLLNIIYIDPFIRWIQFYSEDKIFNIIGELVSKLSINDNNMKLNLSNVEKEFMENNDENEEDVEMK